MSIKKIKINAANPYDIIIGKGVLHNFAEHLPEEFKGKTAKSELRAVIITDDNVKPLYEPITRKSLENAGYNVLTFTFENGEARKSPETLTDILNFLADNKITRSDFIIALGGGIVGDMAGFAAGVYLRGIRYIQAPTTFLAAADSSVGGKTAVNLNAGKNLAGLFYQPRAVICDPDTFATLDDETFADGVAETLKHGFISDENFFARLKGRTRERFMEDITDVVARNVEIKGEIVEADEYETGKRQLLNFGHTAAHALEKCSDYSMSHGWAVAAGMVIMARAAFKKGFCDIDYSEEIRKAFSGFSRDLKINFSAEKMYEAALSDKKKRGEKINIIIPERVGKCVIKEIAASELYEIFKSGLEN